VRKRKERNEIEARALEKRDSRHPRRRRVHAFTYTRKHKKQKDSDKRHGKKIEYWLNKREIIPLHTKKRTRTKKI